MKPKLRKTSAPQDHTLGHFEGERVRELLKQNQTKQAIELLYEITSSQALDLPDLRNELIIHAGRLDQITNDFRSDLIMPKQFEVEQNKIVLNLLKLLDQIDDLTKLSPAESKARTHYLQKLREDVENRLKVSIHNSRFIDIGIGDTPSATHLPWPYKDNTLIQEFDQFEQAFVTYKRRILLLGGPGSGKTTMLLNLSRVLIDEAENDQHAPIPVLFNLSQFHLTDRTRTTNLTSRFRPSDDETEKDVQAEQISNWLIKQLKERDISRETASNWVLGGRIALLLDGLDEVEDEQIIELSSLLNAFLSKYSDIPVVVCSRIIEYQSLQNKEETKLQLAGAVTLKPLDTQQIDAYLEQAQAVALRESLRDSEALYRMAQTPLMLSMMTLAYGDLAPTDIQANASLADIRHNLLQLYVERMMQRKARRDARIPFDTDRSKDVPTQYSVKQVEDYLGWLAVSLSVRSQTVLPLNQLYRFLAKSVDQGWKDNTRKYLAMANAVILFLCSFVIGLILTPTLSGGIGLVTALSGLVVVSYLVVNYLNDPSSQETTIETDDDSDTSTFETIFAVVGVLVLVIGGFLFAAVYYGAITMALGEVLPLPMTPLSLGTVVIALLVVVVYVIIEETIQSRIRYIVLTAISILVPVSVSVFTDWVASPGDVVAISFVTVQGFFFAYLIRVDEDISLSVAVLIVSLVIGAILLTEVIGLGLIAAPEWHEIVMIVGIGLSIILLADAEAVDLVAGAAACTVIGAIWGGISGAVLGFPSALLVLAIAAALQERLYWPVIDRITEWLVAQITKFFDVCILNPILLSVLVVSRVIPFKLSAFLNYTIETFLMKKVHRDYEFIHRLLRDYFAIRELTPMLQDGDAKNRVEVIQRLSRQGESALDTLKDLAVNEAPHIRQAAIAGLGRIATPDVVPLMKAALKDPNPRVRESVVTSLRKLGGSDALELLSIALDDDSPNVRLATVDGILGKIEESQAIRMLGDILYKSDARMVRVVVQAVTERSSDETSWKELGQHIDLTAGDKLIMLLHDRDSQIRQTAVALLGSIGTPPISSALIDALRDPESEVQLEAAKGLGQLGILKALPTLLHLYEQDEHRDLQKRSIISRILITLRLVDDGTSEMKAAALRAMGQMGNASVVPQLLQALGDRNRDVRETAVQYLGQVGDASVVPQLLYALDDRSASVRRAAVQSLGQVGDASVAPQLLQALDDRSASVRRAAVQSLGQVGDAGVVPQLLHALDDRNSDVQEAADQSLAQVVDASVAPQLLQALKDQSPYVRRGAAQSLGQAGDASVVPQLLHALGDRSASVREAAVQSLGQVGDAGVVPQLLHALGDRDADVRGAAAQSLRQVVDASVVPQLLHALGDRDAGVRGAAAQSLGQAGDASVVPQLLQALDDQEPYVRWAAAQSLGQVGDASVVPQLLQALGQAVNASIMPGSLQEWYDREMLEVVARSLGQVADANSVPQLLQALGDRDAGVRWAAAQSLGQVGDASVVPQLLQALEDQDYYVREAAAQSLKQVVDASSVPQLLQALDDQSHYVRWASAQSLGQVGDTSVVPQLLQALDDRNAGVREAATRSLGQVGDASVVPQLLHALGDRDESVRRAAAQSLGQVGDASVVPEYLKLLRDGDGSLVETAGQALGKLADESVLPVLVEALQTRGNSIRSIAAQTLGHIGDPRAIPVLQDHLTDKGQVGQTGKRVCDYAAEALASLNGLKVTNP